MATSVGFNESGKLSPVPVENTFSKVKVFVVEISFATDFAVNDYETNILISLGKLISSTDFEEVACFNHGASGNISGESCSVEALVEY